MIVNTLLSFKLEQQHKIESITNEDQVQYKKKVTKENQVVEGTLFFCYVNIH